MLSYTLSRASDRPLYDQLYRLLRADIESGAIAEGERLPGRRALAAQLGVSKITVENAYQQLTAEGYIHARSRSGYYVDKVDASIGADEADPLSPAREFRRGDGYPVDFVKNSTDPSLFPFSVWARLTRAALAECGSDLICPQPFAGSLALREALCRLLHRMKGISCTPEQIFIGTGGEYLSNLLVQFIGRNHICAMETPGYPLTAQLMRMNDVPLITLPMDEHGVNMEALRNSGADVLILSPSHHFPTGIATPIGRRQEILNWAAEGNRIVIENDFDSEFRFTGMPIPSLMSIDRSGSTVYLNTFSKSISPSVRVSYMVLPPELARKYNERMDFYSCTAPVMEQYVLERFITLGYYDRHIARMKRAYRACRDKVISLIRKSGFASLVTIHEADAGLHFLLRVDTTVSDAALKWALRQAGVRISCLSDYHLGGAPCEQHVLVVNYSGVDLAALEAALPQIEKALFAR